MSSARAPGAEWPITTLSADIAQLAAQVLTRAFFDDPLNLWLLPDEAERTAVLPGIFEAIVRGGVMQNAAWAAGPGVRGVASWLPPGVIELPDQQSEAAGFGAAIAAMGEAAGARAAIAFPHFARLRARAMPEDHWYLGLLGVEPSEQGRGIGAALIRAGLALADASRVPAYLETLKLRNVAFYEGHGFQVVDSHELPAGGPRYWTMRREPR